MKPKIGLITLGVSDLARSREFYERLGWDPMALDDADEIAFFPLQGTWLALFPAAKLAEDAGVPQDGSGFPRFTLAHNEHSKEDVDRVYAEALAAGGREVKRPTDTDWGGYSGYFADPDGFLWELAWNPFTDLT
jgi:catechol 2,3-dioxygenase-like lactoylglutathione lyase family enzyme